MLLYSYIYPVQNGVCRVISADSRYALCDKDMSIIFPAVYEDMGQPRGGFVPAKKDGKWGYLSIKDKNWLVNPAFDQADPFYEGRAAFKEGGLWGFIDNTGKIIIEPMFGEARRFSDGVCGVFVLKVAQMKTLKRKNSNENVTEFFEPPEKLKGKPSGWGFINKWGEFVIPPQYAVISIFQGGLAIVQRSRNSIRLYINKSGMVQTPGDKQYEQKL